KQGGPRSKFYVKQKTPVRVTGVFFVKEFCRVVLNSSFFADDAKFLSNLCERGNGFVKVVLFMCGAELNADARFFFRNNGKKEADDINAFIEELVCESLR